MVRLSICIPTYNRARLLESALCALVPQISGLGGQVELIVSDNCSSDGTLAVVEAARREGPIEYFRNDENLGAARNIALCVERAHGEYVWIIGDDDLVRHDGVRTILAVLQDHSEVDFVHINATTGNRVQDRERFVRPVTGKDFPELLPAKSLDLSQRRIERWEELIAPEIDGVFLGAIMCSVFRRSLWLDYRDCVDFIQPPAFSPDNLYPHAVIFAHSMVGRPAWYIGHPYIIAFWGHQEWSGSVPMIILITLNQLLDVYGEAGVEDWRIERCRRFLLRGSGWPLVLALFKRDLPGRKYFSWREYLVKYGKYRELWIGLAVALIPKPIKRLIRSGMRRARSMWTRSVEEESGGERNPAATE